MAANQSSAPDAGSSISTNLPFGNQLDSKTSQMVSDVGAALTPPPSGQESPDLQLARKGQRAMAATAGTALGLAGRQAETVARELSDLESGRADPFTDDRYAKQRDQILESLSTSLSESKRWRAAAMDAVKAAGKDIGWAGSFGQTILGQAMAQDDPQTLTAALATLGNWQMGERSNRMLAYERKRQEFSKYVNSAVGSMARFAAMYPAAGVGASNAVEDFMNRLPPELLTTVNPAAIPTASVVAQTAISSMAAPEARKRVFETFQTALGNTAPTLRTQEAVTDHWVSKLREDPTASIRSMTDAIANPPVGQHPILNAIRVLAQFGPDGTTKNMLDSALQPSEDGPFEALRKHIEGGELSVPHVAGALNAIRDFVIDGLRDKSIPPKSAVPVYGLLNALLQDPRLSTYSGEADVVTTVAASMIGIPAPLLLNLLADDVPGSRSARAVRSVLAEALHKALPHIRESFDLSGDGGVYLAMQALSNARALFGAMAARQEGAASVLKNWDNFDENSNSEQDATFGTMSGPDYAGDGSLD